MVVAWCWEGDKVAYGTLLQRGVPISSGRFDFDDVEGLVNREVPAGLFTFQDQTPEALGLERDDGKGDECSAFNDFKFPPIFPPDPPPDTLILDVKNNVTNRDLAPQEVKFELIANSQIDRVSIVRTIWNFGDGSPNVTTEGLAGQGPGYRQTHLYRTPVNFNGTVTLQILDVSRNVIDSETSTFSGVINSEPVVTPLNIIVDVFQDSEVAPANVNLEIVANQAIEQISIDYGDGSAPTQSTSHRYSLNGFYIIAVSATSKVSGERATTNRQLILAVEPPPPGGDDIIFDVRRTETRTFPVVPNTVNYKLTLNPAFLNRRFKIQINWFLNNVQEFSGSRNDGDSVTGLNQSFNFEFPGTQNVSVEVNIFDNLIDEGAGRVVFRDSEIFRDLFVTIEEVIEPVICDPGFHEENGVCVMDDQPPIECAPGFHEENGVCVPDDDIPLECDPGFHEENGVCVLDSISCAEGFHEENGVCVPDLEIECAPGFHLENGACVPDEPPIECAPGFHLENGICVPNDPPGDCDPGFHLENGACVPNTVDCDPGFHEEFGVCVVNPPPGGDSKRNRNIAIAAGAVVAAGVAAVALTSK